jgi:nucleotide-binding universal stress UspA family protein
MKTIIAGVDFTQSSYNAARYAALLARKLECKLVLFNMFDVPLIHSNSGLYFMSYNSIRDTSVNKLKKFLARLSKEFPKLDMNYFVTTGSFEEEVNTFVKKHHVQMVVLGLATKNRFSKFIYGSHSTDVAGKIDAPVIVVPEKYKEHKIKSLVVAVDNKEKLHKAALHKLEGLRKDAKLNLRMVHVRTEDELFDHKNNNRVEMGAKKYSVEVLSESSLERGLKKYALDHAVDLITVISHRHSALYNMFNETNTKQIAFSSKVPVMAIHD